MASQNLFMQFKKIFLSYSRADASEVALKLALALKEAGFNIWIDQLDIRAGALWDMEIENALETCDCFLFIQSENSIKSTHVLNEVYYALEQNKTVIPIMTDACKTPFRLRRLNYIDFINNYEGGLRNLLKELNAPVKYRHGEVSSAYVAGNIQSEGGLKLKEVSNPRKKISSSKIILLIAAIAIIASAVFILSQKDPTQKINKNENGIITTDTSAKNPDTGKATTKSEANTTGMAPANDKKQVNAPGNKVENLIEIYAGRWELTEVIPKALAKEGSLKIEATDGNKVKIDAWYKFEFFKQNDTAYFSNLIGDAVCSSCELKREMHIPNHIVTIHTQTYETIKETNPIKGKTGDTIRNAGGIRELNVSVYLYLKDKNKIIIKVRLPETVIISPQFIVKPFETSFVFLKIFD